MLWGWTLFARTARTQGLQQRGRHWKLMWYCCIWWILVFCKCRLLKDYFLTSMAWYSSQSGWGGAEGGGGWADRKGPAFPGKCQMYFDHILGPLGMVLERDDSTRCDTGSSPWERPRNGREDRVRSPPVTSDIMEIGQCCKAALSLKIRISAKVKSRDS